MLFSYLNYCCDYCGDELKVEDVFGTGEVVDDADVVCFGCGRQGAIECGESGDFRVVGITDEEREVIRLNQQPKK